MNGKVGLAIGAGLGVAVIGGLLYFAFAPVDVETVSSWVPPVDQPARKSKRTSLPSAAASRPVKMPKNESVRPSKPRMRVPEDWFAKLPSAKDRAIAKRIQDAQDGDDVATVLSVSGEALSSKSVEVRQAAVDALSLQGTAAMPTLLEFVGDADKDVADSAYRAWDDAVDTVEGESDKLTAVRAALGRMTDPEHVKSAVGKIESLDRARAIRELAKLARDGGSVAEAAKESYENVTGEKFESWAMAELRALSIDRDNAEAESNESK